MNSQFKAKEGRVSLETPRDQGMHEASSSPAPLGCRDGVAYRDPESFLLLLSSCHGCWAAQPSFWWWQALSVTGRKRRRRRDRRGAC